MARRLIHLLDRGEYLVSSPLAPPVGQVEDNVLYIVRTDAPMAQDRALELAVALDRVNKLDADEAAEQVVST